MARKNSPRQLSAFDYSLLEITKVRYSIEQALTRRVSELCASDRSGGDIYQAVTSLLDRLEELGAMSDHAEPAEVIEYLSELGWSAKVSLEFTPYGEQLQLYPNLPNITVSGIVLDVRPVLTDTVRGWRIVVQPYQYIGTDGMLRPVKIQNCPRSVALSTAMWAPDTLMPRDIVPYVVEFLFPASMFSTTSIDSATFNLDRYTDMTRTLGNPFFRRRIERYCASTLNPEAMKRRQPAKPTDVPLSQVVAEMTEVDSSVPVVHDEADTVSTVEDMIPEPKQEKKPRWGLGNIFRKDEDDHAPRHSAELKPVPIPELGSTGEDETETVAAEPETDTVESAEPSLPDVDVTPEPEPEPEPVVEPEPEPESEPEEQDVTEPETEEELETFLNSDDDADGALDDIMVDTDEPEDEDTVIEDILDGAASEQPADNMIIDDDDIDNDLLNSLYDDNDEMDDVVIIGEETEEDESDEDESEPVDDDSSDEPEEADEADEVDEFADDDEEIEDILAGVEPEQSDDSGDVESFLNL